MSATGMTEFSFNKRIVELVFKRLKDSPLIAPCVINPQGGPIMLPERTRIAADKGAELFLSIHHDSVQDKYLTKWSVGGKSLAYCDDFHGYGVFVSAKNAQAAHSETFARLLGGAMRGKGFEFALHHSEAVQGENRPILDKFLGVYLYNDLIVLKTAPMPAVLLECGVIVNRVEEAQMIKPETQERIVQAIVSAVTEYFESAQKRER